MYQSQMITDVVTSEETNKLVCASLGINHQEPVHYMVFTTQVKEQQLSCCLAGGMVDGDSIHLTPVGTGAYEALDSLPGNEIQMYRLPDDDAQLESQISDVLQQHKSGDRLCFITDTLVERQQLLREVFNLQD